MILRGCAFLGAVMIAALGGLLASKLADIDLWTIWDTLIQQEPADTPVVLSPRLQYDTEGALSGRIRIALAKMGIRYRTIDREFPVLPTVVPSSDVTISVIEQGEDLLELHGGDVIVYGSVGTADNQVFIRIFARSDCGCVHGATPFDLSSENWESTLKVMIEAVMTTSLDKQYQGTDWIKSGRPLSQAMRDWEQKLGKLANLVEDPTFKERADDLAKHSKLLRMKVEGDGTGIQELRRKTKARIANELAQCRDNESRCSIRRELLFLADLEIYDGLMNDLPERIQEGLSLALLSGQDAMDREAQDDPAVVRSAMQSAFRDWLAIAILILACDDPESMQRFVDLLDAYLSSNREIRGSRPGDVERMLWPMVFLKQVGISKENLEEFEQYLSQHRYFGWPEADYWQDPFLHARRTIRRRIQRVESKNVSQLDNRFMGQPQCPALSEWLSIKGW